MEISNEDLLEKVVYSVKTKLMITTSTMLQQLALVFIRDKRDIIERINYGQVGYLCSKKGFKVDVDPSEASNFDKLETRHVAKLDFDLQYKWMVH